MNTLKSRTNECNRFIYQFTMHGKTLNLNTTTANFTPTLNVEFNLPDGSYSVSDIQDYFEYSIKKHETIADNPPVQVYVNKIKK